jgi:hypothetical protein
VVGSGRPDGAAPCAVAPWSLPLLSVAALASVEPPNASAPIAPAASRPLRSLWMTGMKRTSFVDLRTSSVGEGPGMRLEGGWESAETLGAGAGLADRRVRP